MGLIRSGPLNSPTPPMTYLILMSTSLSIFLPWPLAPNLPLSLQMPLPFSSPADGSWRRCLVAAAGS